MTKLFIWFVLFSYINPIVSVDIFSIQESLTVLCYQFPLVSSLNDSDFLCSRLRVNGDIPTSEFNLQLPTQISLFIILDQSSAVSSPVNIFIDFTQSINSPSSIDEINFSILVLGSNFTVNNQTAMVYTPDEIPVFNWKNSTDSFYNVINIIRLNNQDYNNDKSLCKWKSDQWNGIFNINTSNILPYAYFLQSNNSQLSFTLINTNSTSLTLTPPSPYLSILYCIPYKLGVIEIVLLSSFSAFFITIIIIFSISHYLKGDEENRTRHVEFDHSHRRDTHTNSKRDSSKSSRHRSNASSNTLDQDSDS